MIKRVIAVGSPHGDDQIAWRVLEALESCVENRLGIELWVRDRPGLSLLNDFDPAIPTLLVDAADFGGRVGETLLYQHPHKMEPGQAGQLSGHGIGVQSLLDLAQSLGYSLPPLDILAIQIKTVSPMAPMSAELQQRLPDLVATLRSCLTPSSQHI